MYLGRQLAAAGLSQMLVKKVYRSLQRFGMIRSGERVLVALSGGPDSVALTHALIELAATEEFELRLAHLNHQLREDGDADEAFCAELARRLELPFASRRIDVAGEAQRNGYSLEEQARISRYRFLSETAERWLCARIAVGHTRDDQAETFLLRLLRGSGTTGLAAIRPVTSMPTSFSPSSKAGLVRPMLEVTRSEVLAFLDAKEIAYRLDRTNLDPSIPRNRVRHQTLPFLARHHNPNVTDTLARTAELLQDDEDWMEQEARRTLASLIEDSGRHGNRIRLSVKGLERLHPALRRRVVRGAVGSVRGELRAVTSRHIEDVLGLISPGRSGRRLCLPGLDCGRSFDAIWFKPAAPRHPAAKGYNSYEYALTVPGELQIPEAGGAIRAVEANATSLPPAAGETVKIALGEVNGPLDLLETLSVRSPLPGDRFRPLGAPGSKSVARYLMERRVDRDRRRLIPLVVRGVPRSDQEILWVVGHGVSEASRVNRGARRVLQLSWSTV
ncbi:MAG: tRNA lysidine(34) synthetase TilS [Vicinamibacteria bacterium]